MVRAVRLNAFGDPNVLTIEDINVVAPAIGEIRLRISAIGINRAEMIFRSGRSPLKPALPTGLGFEAAGVVDAVGPGVDGIQIGDRVALVPAYSPAQYALYAEVAIAPARSVVAVDGDDFVLAAATWAAYGTAWCGLVALGGLTAGQTVLLTAASSSVGLAAIQIANQLGARPIALTCTPSKADTLRELGAAAVIVTTEEDIVAAVKRLTEEQGANLVFDAVGGARFPLLTGATVTGGVIIVYGALAEEPTVLPSLDLLERSLTIRGLALTAMTKDDGVLASLKRFVTAGIAGGTLRPHIAAIFPFEEIADAHRLMESGQYIGKIVAVT
jgi:NADPH:quinone reductase-like Zn-dependent oxidoreductase